MSELRINSFCKACKKPVAVGLESNSATLNDEEILRSLDEGEEIALGHMGILVDHIWNATIEERAKLREAIVAWRASYPPKLAEARRTVSDAGTRPSTPSSGF